MEPTLCSPLKLISTLMLLLMCYEQGATLRCYDCQSLNTIRCNDPFSKNSTSSKEYDTGYVCVKIKGDLKKGDGFIVQREGMLEHQFDELVASKTFPDVEMLKCKTDLCNAAVVHSVTVSCVTVSVIMGIATSFFRI